MRASSLKNSLITIGSAIFILVIWAAISNRIGIEIILPSPIVTGKHLVSIFQSDYFWPVNNFQVKK